jgi:tetratricopeptide (TPR) repeat protein
MNERFLFMPSLGFSILAGYLIYRKLPMLIKSKTKQKPVVMGLVIIILVLYGFKTIDRNRDWKDDFTLFTHDVKISSESAKSNCTAGGKLLEKAKTIEDEQKKKEYLERSIGYLRKSLRIHPTYKDPMLLLGNAHIAYNRNYDSAIYYYKKLLKRNPQYDLAYNNIHKIFTGYDSVDYKINVYEDLMKINPKRFEVNYQLGNLYGKEKKNLKKALYYLKRAAKLNPASKKTWKDLGVAYGMSGNIDQSIQALQKAIQIDPKDPQLYINLSISYKIKGNAQKAREYLIKGKQLKQK